MLERRVLAFHYAWYGTPWGPTGTWRAWNHAIMTTDRESVGQTYDTTYVPTLDALCSYDPFIYSLQGIDLKQLYREKCQELKAKGARFAATANPGFDNRALHKPGLHVPRENGGYYRMTWQACLNSTPDFVVINSFNEWGESSVIESTRQFGKDYIEYTREFAERFKQS